MRLLDYLGKPATHLLTSLPFKDWDFERSIDDDLPEQSINYEAGRHGFSFTCDNDETINTIFVESDDFDQSLLDIPFSLGRWEVQSILGAPSKSGKSHSDPVLGEYGPWDRYDEERHSIHIGYQPYADRIRRITLTRADMVSGTFRRSN
ncbi:hypothetical protein FJV76_03855 [Mesorhizobium sp. WSM4303]|uniref:hypothetical protein n=1 Tax=unclassified Mesorhizobium TaxID=325217 RepID=UPI00115ED881|nr:MULTISPECIES: hypothetical protein [unclassified Mesorhizobium]TRD00560.1 hypothetical protein FJV77_01625 [Mesorhizobium sp. WSM4306]TRD07496.1 hypothetical protein FJV76_03855 [Mesorhizobium sp. WSM4303]